MKRSGLYWYSTLFFEIVSARSHDKALKSKQIVNGEEKSSFTFEDAMAFVGAEVAELS